MNKLWLLLFIIFSFLGFSHYLSHREVATAPGVLVKDEPIQKNRSDKVLYQHGNYTLEALADFEIRARVLSKQRYQWDAGATLVPVDLALGWGPMSDSTVLAALTISQGGRFYRYRWQNAPPIPVQEIVRHSTNMHLIPTTKEIEEKIRRARPGQIVEIKGQLVEARSADGFRWRSSLTREDSGGGACELVRVEEFALQ
jgi:hypothetical protein